MVYSFKLLLKTVEVLVMPIFYFYDFFSIFFSSSPLSTQLQELKNGNEILPLEGLRDLEEGLLQLCLSLGNLVPGLVNFFEQGAFFVCLSSESTLTRVHQKGKRGDIPR